MHTDVFIDKVRRHLGFHDSGIVHRITTATLATLGQRIHKPHRQKLAAVLPPELTDALLTYPEEDRFDLEEFYNRVGARADVGYPEAVEGAQAVCAILREAAGRSHIDLLLSTIPAQYQELFGAPPQSALSPSHHKPGAGA